MPEAQPPPPPGGTPSPAGPIRHAWFAGLFEGKAGDRTRIEAAAQRVRDICAGGSLDFEGDRFALVMDEKTIQPTRDRKSELVEALHDLVLASSDAQSIESTLRCTEVYDNAVVETLFAPLHGQVGEVSRVRAATPDDLRRGGATQRSGTGFGKGRIALISVLMVLAVSMLVWQAGIWDRVWAVPAEQLDIDTGLFGDLVAVQISADYGNYRITMRRGPAYPATTGAADALEQAANSTAERAAVLAVSSGDVVHVQLVSETDEVLWYARASLRALLLSEDAEVDAMLPGRIDARAVQLVLGP